MIRDKSPPNVSDDLERWLGGDGDHTLGALIELFGSKSFAHVFELISILLGFELMAGRDEIWLPQRWRRLELAGRTQQRFIHGLMRLIRRLERLSHPRLRFLFGHRVSSLVFGALVVGLVGVVLEIALGEAVLHGIGALF